MGIHEHWYTQLWKPIWSCMTSNAFCSLRTGARQRVTPSFFHWTFHHLTWTDLLYRQPSGTLRENHALSFYMIQNQKKHEGSPADSKKQESSNWATWATLGSFGTIHMLWQTCVSVSSRYSLNMISNIVSQVWISVWWHIQIRFNLCIWWGIVPDYRDYCRNMIFLQGVYLIFLVFRANSPKYHLTPHDITCHSPMMLFVCKLHIPCVCKFEPQSSWVTKPSQ